MRNSKQQIWKYMPACDILFRVTNCEGGSKKAATNLAAVFVILVILWHFTNFVTQSSTPQIGRQVHLYWANKNRRKASFNWAAKGLFFLRGGGGFTDSGYHKTLSPTIAWDRISGDTETQTHSENIVPFWKTFVTKRMSTIFKWGLYGNF